MVILEELKYSINNMFNYYLKIHYFAQKFFGWKRNPSDGLKRLLVDKILFYSAGLFFSIVLFLVRNLSLIFLIVYILFYYYYCEKLIIKQIDSYVNFKKLDEEYSKTSTLKKVIFTIISFCSVIMNVVGMVLIIYFYSRFFQ